MTAVILVTGVRHIVRAFDPADGRLAWTRCGLRFAWGSGRIAARVTRCAECMA